MGWLQKCQNKSRTNVQLKNGTKMGYFLEQLINGLSLGSIYGLIAIGYTMVYEIIDMVNFAHDEVFMIDAFHAVIAYLVLQALGITLLPVALIIVLVVTIFLTSAYGWTIEKIAYRPLRGSFRLAPLISAIGMSVLLQNYVQLLQEARPKSVPSLIQGNISLIESEDFSVSISYLRLFIIIATVVLMVFFTMLITKTALGRSQRACEQDMKMATLLGINVDRVISLTFVIGASLAAVAGLMFMLFYGVVDFYMGFIAGVKAFSAAVLGGIGSLPGAMLGGILLGVIESLFSAYFSVEYKDLAAFSVLVLVLIFRPTGLLGKPEVEKV